MTFGIIVTNYNTWDLTTTCIEHCLKFNDDQIDKFVVIDDCSTERFENQFNDQIVLEKNKENIGLVRSLNRGLSLIETDIIVLFDSDAWPLEKFVFTTKDYFRKNPDVGIATFITENDKGSSPSFENEPSSISLLLGQKMYHNYQKIFIKKNENITVYTCAMVIRKQVLEKIGCFDINFDWLELDHDICMRASRAGWKIGIIPVRAYHRGSGTPQKVGDRVVRFYKNRLYLLKKFNKIRSFRIFIFIVKFRLSVEKVLLDMFGGLIYRNREIQKDKVQSRAELILYLKNQHSC